MNTRARTAFLSVLMAVILTGCASATPTGAVKSFYGAVADGDYDKAVGMFSSNAVSTFGINKLKELVASQAEQIEQRGGVRTFTVTDETIVGDRAVVYYEMVLNDGTTESSSVTCIKEDGQWKIDISK